MTVPWTFPHKGIEGIERRVACEVGSPPFTIGALTYIVGKSICVRIEARQGAEETASPALWAIARRIDKWAAGSESIKEWAAWPEFPADVELERCLWCADVPDDEECSSCWGSGEYVDKHHRVVLGAYLSTGNFALVGSLPSVEAGGKEQLGEEMVAFRFKGGIGFVMPMKELSETYTCRRGGKDLSAPSGQTIVGIDADTQRVALASINLSSGHIPVVLTIDRANTRGAVDVNYDYRLRETLTPMTGHVDALFLEDVYTSGGHGEIPANPNVAYALKEVHGEIKMIARSFGIRVEMVSPIEWHNAILFETKGRETLKRLAMEKASEAFRGQMTEHEADAFCIALYGLQVGNEEASRCSG